MSVTADPPPGSTAAERAAERKAAGLAAVARARAELARRRLEARAARGELTDDERAELATIAEA